METKEIRLVPIDLESSTTSFDSLLAECKEKGNVEIVDYGSEEFRADVTGQKGSVSYTVKGEKANSMLGADTVAKLSLKGNIPVQIDKDREKAFLISEHFTKLRSAMRRQKAEIAKKSKRS
ncbi:unnamed protein product [marine sediment metagenome]|uniref:Uncharacterized protein n=1 Tax=marine sediment metagenome TaxID=412755 RepID=X1G466_9ZZZZ